MGFVDLALLEIRLGNGPPVRVDVGVFVPIDDEPTEGGPLGQQPLYRRRVWSLQLGLQAVEFLNDRLLNENVFPADFSMRLRRSHSAEEPFSSRNVSSIFTVGK